MQLKALFFITLVALSGCSSLGVEPWQRGILSMEEMTPQGNAVDQAFDDHIYFSKEASSGGAGFGGGGCGCN